jgi:hypothetical protein
MGDTEIRAGDALGIRITGQGIAVDSLPFSPGDITAGTENELQTAVSGSRERVDLPLAIEESRYYSNIARRIAAGEAPQQSVDALRRYLDQNREEVWENSWVRFPLDLLSRLAREVLDDDLHGGKQSRFRRRRSDIQRFVFEARGEEWLRVPISYLVKLALVDVLGTQTSVPAKLRAVAMRVVEHLTNDNSSPETSSFHIVSSADSTRIGESVASEMAIRFLLTHLLVEWANKNMGLEATGQRALVYFAPHPPVRQKELNDCISDAFYRELFMSPCLSGWDDGEGKREYMHLAHQSLSRSQLNAMGKLREAGIITNDLVVLPNASNISLANNGVHLSLGSDKISRAVSDPSSGFKAMDEKRIGDLVIKISEHFLPLFVDTYTAAPYRLAFTDFRPERILSFLPHELDYTHLRMIWRHWKRKARLRFLGHTITPWGPRYLDAMLGRVFRLRGDLIPDFRLVDFPVAWLSTEGSSALDGLPGNCDRLKDDLDSIGVCDRRLKLYLPIALREFAQIGFSGFESRQFSLFHGMVEDFAPAVGLQQLVTMLAIKYVFSGAYQHQGIPDDPSSESERRQPFFYAALGLKAFNVRSRTGNLFLQHVLRLIENQPSSRHPDYSRVPTEDYRRALLNIIRRDGSELIEMLGLSRDIDDLDARLRDKKLRAGGKLLQGVLDKAGSNHPFSIDARDFNQAAEGYYREDLRTSHLKEALDCLRRRIRGCAGAWDDFWGGQTVRSLDGRNFLNTIEAKLLAGSLTPDEIRDLIYLVLIVVKEDLDRAGDGTDPGKGDAAPIYRTEYAASLN